jgi:hypothetical protein
MSTRVQYRIFSFITVEGRVAWRPGAVHMDQDGACGCLHGGAVRPKPRETAQESAARLLRKRIPCMPGSVVQQPALSAALGNLNRRGYARLETHVQSGRCRQQDRGVKERCTMLALSMLRLPQGRQESGRDGRKMRRKDPEGASRTREARAAAGLPLNSGNRGAALRIRPGRASSPKACGTAA